jgi:hypothetical protein
MNSTSDIFKDIFGGVGVERHNRLYEALLNSIEYFIREYDITFIEIMGILETLKQDLHHNLMHNSDDKDEGN